MRENHNKPATIPLRLFMPGVDEGAPAMALTTFAGRLQNGLTKVVG